MGGRKCAGVFWYCGRHPPPKRRRRWRHNVVRFLPTQEWSTGVREVVGGFWLWAAIVAALRQGDSCFRRNGLVGGRKCAGVFWHCGRHPPPKRRRRWRHIFVRFLPTQEWSTCVQEVVCGFWLWAAIVAAIAARRFLLPQEWSCVGTPKNRQNTPPIVRRRQQSPGGQQPTPKSSTHFRFPGRPFLRRQESHKHVSPTAA